MLNVVQPQVTFLLGGGSVDLIVKLWNILHEGNITLTLLIGAAACSAIVILLVLLSVAYRGGLGCSNPPHPEIPKALQNCAKLNPICENC